jgi:hypothetical protein
MLLNYVPPSYEFSEYHNIVIQASPDHVFTTVKQITLNEVSFFYVLFMKRALPTPILHKVGLPFWGKQSIFKQALRRIKDHLNQPNCAKATMNFILYKIYRNKPNASVR